MAANPTIYVIDEAELESYTHSPAEIEDYAAFLGIDLEHERDLFAIAEAGLRAPLPAPWQACLADGQDELFYFNPETGQSVWDHPCDHEYLERLQEERASRVHVPVSLRLQSGGGAIVGTNLAGAVVATVEVQDPEVEAFRDVEDRLKESLSLPAGTVARFVLPDATLLGHSHGARSVAELFGL